MDIVYVLGSGSKWSDNEIRFSLRSIEKNLSETGRIYVVGNKPDFLTKIIHLPVPDIFDPSKNADGNMTHKLLTVCRDARLSENFLFFNDDFIVLKPIACSQIPWYHKGDMALRPPEYWTSQFYRYRLKATFDVLIKNQKPTLQYDYHAPMKFNKKDFIRVMSDYDYGSGIGLTFRSLYGNSMQLPAELLVHQKKTVFKYFSYSDLLKRVENSIFLGYNDQGLNNELKLFLSEIFPLQSKYESDPLPERYSEILNWLESTRDFETGVNIYARYFNNQNLLQLFYRGETPCLRNKLEYKFNTAINDLRRKKTTGN